VCDKLAKLEIKLLNSQERKKENLL
jgi:hypothetical protein